MVGEDIGVEGQFDQAVFEGGLIAGHVVAIPVAGKHHLLNAGAVALHGGFGEILAVAAGVHGPGDEIGEAIGDKEEDLFLLAEGDVAEFDDEGGTADGVALELEGPDDGEVAGAAEILAEEGHGGVVEGVQVGADEIVAEVAGGAGAVGFGAAGEVRGQLPADDGDAGAHTALDEDGGEIGAAGGAGNTEQFLGGVVAKLGEDLGAPGGLGGAGPFAAELGGDAMVEAVGHGVVEGDAMEGVGFAAGADIVDEFIEGAVGAVVSGHDADTSAPHGEGEGGFEEAVEIVVKGGLVDDGAALFAAEVGRAGREGDDFVAGGEAEAIGEEVAAVVVDGDFLDGAGGLIELTGPGGGGLDEFAGHILVVAEVPGIHAAGGGGGEGAGGGLGPGEADAAGFLGDFNGGLVGHPADLIGQEDILALAGFGVSVGFH